MHHLSYTRNSLFDTCPECGMECQFFVADCLALHAKLMVPLYLFSSELFFIVIFLGKSHYRSGHYFCSPAFPRQFHSTKSSSLTLRAEFPVCPLRKYSLMFYQQPLPSGPNLKYAAFGKGCCHLVNSSRSSIH